MNLFDFDIVNAEKTSAVNKFNRFRTIAKLFRLFEFCVAFVLFMWSCTRIPFVVKISREYFRQLISVIVSPLFVFVLCNAIIISLLAKSGLFFGHDINNFVTNIENELYEELTENSTSIDCTRSKSEIDDILCETEEVNYQDKKIISEVNVNDIEDEVASETDSDSDSDSDCIPNALKRSQSEKIEHQCLNKDVKELRRSETKKYQNFAKAEGEYTPEILVQEEELSGEEFMRTVEDFIARQWRFRRQESLSVVLHNQS